jgi:hypothetical protein
MTTGYRLAVDVEQVALEVIEAHRRDLADVSIVYLFVDPPPTHLGRTIWGHARKITGLSAVLADLAAHDGAACTEPVPFAVVEISEEIWGRLDARRRRALVDHELMHLAVVQGDDGPVLKMRGHDFEEFVDVIRRHGLWTSAAEATAAAVAEQLVLALDDTLADVMARPPDG